MITVDARGEICPIPLIKAKEAIKNLSGPELVEVFVDNEIAVQNLKKMAVQMGYGVRPPKRKKRPGRWFFM
ncbi:MAG: sulfurtransferase TusA family protein [Clostridium sp.]